MTHDEIAQRLAKLVAETTKATERISRGEISLAEANEEHSEYVDRQRAEMTTEEFQLFTDGVGRLSYLWSSELSKLGHPLPGNDPKKPN